MRAFACYVQTLVPLPFRPFPQCTAMKISACACSYNWSLKNTLIINFICIALSSGPAAVAIFFSTSCGRSRYLNQWSDVFLQVWFGFSPHEYTFVISKDKWGRVES